MNKFDQFLKRHGLKIVIAFLILNYFKTCSTNSQVERLEEQVKTNETRLTELDSSLKAVNQSIKSLPTDKDLKIEGLKSEKRMIQSTSRRMIDVERQNVIEQEITRLSEK